MRAMSEGRVYQKTIGSVLMDAIKMLANEGTFPDSQATEARRLILAECRLVVPYGTYSHIADVLGCDTSIVIREGRRLGVTVAKR